jgi:hypothetical protein
VGRMVFIAMAFALVNMKDRLAFMIFVVFMVLVIVVIIAMAPLVNVLVLMYMNVSVNIVVVVPTVSVLITGGVIVASAVVYGMVPAMSRGTILSRGRPQGSVVLWSEVQR